MSLRHSILFIVLLISGWLAFFGDKTPNADIAEPVIHPSSRTGKVSRTARVSEKTKPVQEPDVLNIVPREDVPETLDYDSKQGSLFDSQTWAPMLPPPVVRLSKSEPLLPLVAPPLPFTYLGKKLENGTYEVYLGRGSETLIAHEKMIIDQVYRVDSINESTMYLNYLPLHQVQVMPIGGND